MGRAATRGSSLRNKLQLVQARALSLLRNIPIKIDRAGIRVLARFRHVKTKKGRKSLLSYEKYVFREKRDDFVLSLSFPARRIPVEISF